MHNPVKFVSLGPGEAELITLKGLKTLQQADKIFTPSTIAPSGKLSSRSKDILLELGIDESKISLFDVPMNKDRSLAIISYKQVAEQIEIDVKKGYKTVVVAEGDAGFYSSTHYISDNLMSKDLSTEKIAGVPAFIAYGALANIHIAKLEEELNVIPGIISSESLIKKIEEGKNVVIMKPSQSEEAIKHAISSMHEANVHYFENTGVKDKEFYTQDVEEIANRKFPYFSLLIITKK